MIIANMKQAGFVPAYFIVKTKVKRCDINVSKNKLT